MPAPRFAGCKIRSYRSTGRGSRDQRTGGERGAADPARSARRRRENRRGCPLRDSPVARSDRIARPVAALEIGEQAEKEAQLILREARADGEKIVEDARSEIRRLQDQIVSLDRSRLSRSANRRRKRRS